MLVGKANGNNSMMLGIAKSGVVGAGVAFAANKCVQSPKFYKVAEEGFFKSALLAEKCGAKTTAGKLLNVACTLEEKAKNIPFTVASSGRKVAIFKKTVGEKISTNKVFAGMKEGFAELKNTKGFEAIKAKLAPVVSKIKTNSTVSKILQKTKLNTPMGKLVLTGAAIGVGIYIAAKAIKGLLGLGNK